MTAARQQRKSRGLVIAVVLALAGGVLGPNVARAATTEQIVADVQTGLAISGFDPVSYFTDSRPKIGRAEVEYGFARVTWRFDNEGNRAAFMRDPEVYMPRFGGYDPVAIARGASVAGHPLYWVVVHERLYLFYDATARAAFLKDPDRYIDAAERKWPEVSKTLTP